MTQTSLPANYYVDYFKQMVDVVSQRYADLLPPEDISFLHHIEQCSEPALRLLIRLYLRKGPNFLVDKLKYPEVPDVASAVDELATLNLIEINPLVFAHELIDILPIAQSRPLFSDDMSCRKSDLIAAWLDDETLQTCIDWGVADAILSPTNYFSLRRLQLLYFGNERQTLTPFILEDIGLFSYVKYHLNKENRLFSSLQDIEQLMLLNDLRAEFYLMNELKQWHELPNLSENAMELKLTTHLKPTWFRFLNRIAYRLEQLGELTMASAIFNSNTQPPARERLTRILFKQECHEAAHTLLQTINANPLNAEEIQFYRRFSNKVRSKLGLAKIQFKKHPINSINICLERGDGNVEEQAVAYFTGSVWLENNLPLAIFGLIYWPAIFADIPGVWHHPFQAAPTDLSDPEFCTKRRDILALIAHQTKANWRNAIEHTWQQKNGLRNPFVHWSNVDLSIVLACFDALSKTQWLGIFTHLLSDIRQYRSGFPDLFQITEDHYRFIEIKGPGDKLQDNQIAWLEKFDELNVCADVCYVQYLDH